MGIITNYGSFLILTRNHNNNCVDGVNGNVLPLYVNNNNNIATSEKKINNNINNNNSDGDIKVLNVKNRRELYFFLYLCGYILYLISGASLFCYLESPGEIELKFSLEKAKRLFYMKYPNVKGTLLITFVHTIYLFIIYTYPPISTLPFFYTISLLHGFENNGFNKENLSEIDLLHLCMLEKNVHL